MNFFKNAINEYIDINSDLFLSISHKIHETPELGNKEFFASDLLCGILENEKFTIERKIAGHDTAFIAEKKSNKEGPSIVFLAEYDSLPGLGHACGHNIIGTCSVAAAIALGKVIDEVGGTIYVYGTPAEEGGENGSAKGSFVKHNLFQGIDAALMIHPSNDNSLSSESLAVDPIDFEFIGKPAHAAACPEEGINALDALILFFNGINALRQHVTRDVRIHGIITHGGDMPNIIPEYTKARFYIRAATREGRDEVTKKIKAIAEGSAIATGCKWNAIAFQNPVDNFIVNKEFDLLFKEQAEEAGIFIDHKIKTNFGSTDAGNVSHVVPTLHAYIKIGPSSLIGHTKEFCEAAKSQEADEALIKAAKSLAYTAYTLLTDKNRLLKIKETHNNSK